MEATAECTMEIKIEVDEGRGGGGGGGGDSCQVSSESSMTRLHIAESEVRVDEVVLVAKQLLHLDDIGNREEFHRQCCEVSCCTAKEVIQIMRNQSYKLSLLQMTSESFLLQDLLNPSHYGCTEELLNSWLLVQEDEGQGTATILENINKMLALVESVDHLVIFLRSIVKRFGSRFLGLCSSLALRVLKQQRHLTSSDGSQMDNACKMKLTQTVESISQMYYGKCWKLYLSCLLTLLYIDPSDVHYFALETFFFKSDDEQVTVNVNSSVDLSIYSDLLSTVNLLRPMSLDLELDWQRLKIIAMDLLCRAGYQYDPVNNTFRHIESFSAKVCGNWSRLGVCSGVEDDSDLTTNEEKIETEGSSWRNDSSKGLSCDLKTTTALPLSDRVSSQNVDSCCEIPKSDDQTVDKGTGNKSLMPSVDLPDSTLTDLVSPLSRNHQFPAYDDSCSAVNGSIADAGVVSADDKCKGKRLWRTVRSREEGFNSLDIVSTENEGGDSLGGEDIQTSQASSIFSKKRSISADILSPSQESVEPSHKLRAIGSDCSKILKMNKDKGENSSTETRSRHEVLEESSHSKRLLRPKDRLERVQTHVTRKTFFFKYTFPKKLHARDAEKRSVSESEASHSDRISLNKSKYTLPNGIRLKKCFIRLNRVEANGKEQHVEDREPVSEEVQVEDKIQEESVTSTEESPMETDLSKDKVPEEEKVVQCVCDGCGEVVPDCSWLTAHIVTCTGQPDNCNNDDSSMMDEELTGSFQPDAPIWNSMENRESGAENTVVVVPSTDASDANGSLGNILPIESNNDIVSFATPTSSEVDTANLVNLLHNHDNTSSSSSSFVYETASSDTARGIKVIQISNDDTPYSMSDQQQSVVNDISDERFGKEIIYNGVYMFEFAEYQCNMCLLAFASQSAAADHVQSSDHGQSTISRNSFCCCLKCSIRYREKHIMWLHSQYTCGNAVEELADDSRLYRCLLCSKAFLSSAFLRRHVYLQHGRELGFGSFVGTLQQQVVTATDGVNNMSQLSAQSCTQLGLNDVPPVVSHLTDYRVGLNSSLIGSWYQVNEEANQLGNQALEDQPVVFPMQTQVSMETKDLETFPEAKEVERNGTGMAPDSVAVSVESGSTDSQALLDLACSIVLGSSSSPQTNFSDNSVSTSHPTTVTTATVSSSKSPSSGQSRRTAKGIMYKNVFMQCIVNYLCSTCKKDLSTKASKKEHKSSPCFDANSKRFTYLRQYSYLCPYCSEKFPSQKFCRQHQLTVCLQLMGVKTDELNHKQLLCPFCDRKYFNIITLKGHMTLIHKVNKIDSSQLLGSSGLLDELISYAPDGLSEKAKDAKKKVKDENERRELEESNGLSSKDIPTKKPAPSIKSNVSSDRKSELDSSKDIASKDRAVNMKEISSDVSDMWANEKQGRNWSGMKNGLSHDSRQHCSSTDAKCDNKEANTPEISEEMDPNDLHIDADADDLTFDEDASSEVASTDELSEFDEELNCETDSLPMKPEPHESHFSKTDEPVDGKKSLKWKKSKKTRKKVVTKSSRKLH